jgi:cytochrome c oxidase subunit II
VWFKAEETGLYDLVCAELCGWGHYKMAGRVRVVTQDEYAQWLADLKADWFSNGTEDLR